jgi:hypothetical protein
MPGQKAYAVSPKGQDLGWMRFSIVRCDFPRAPAPNLVQVIHLD